MSSYIYRKIKGVGGAIGLTDNDTSLRTWLVTGLEIARLLNEFENTGKIHTIEEIEEHHDSNAVSQVKFQLEKVFIELGNPFIDNSKDLKSLGTNIVMDESNTENLFKVEAAGQQQFKDYWESRIIHHRIPVSNTITKNKFHIFTKPKKDLSKTQKPLKLMKNNIGLFSRLFIACQTRNGDLDTFFAHENQESPPSLWENGSLKLPKKKSEILQCLSAIKMLRNLQMSMLKSLMEQLLSTCFVPVQEKHFKITPTIHSSRLLPIS